MLDADNDPPAFDLPDADLTYAHYLETCRRLGVERCHASARKI